MGEDFTTDIAKICVTHFPFPALNACDRNGYTPLTLLVSLSAHLSDALPAAKLLVKHGADADLKRHGEPGRTALEICQKQFALLETYGAWDDDDARKNVANLISYLESVTDQ